MITPSFHRPQYLRNATAAKGLGNVPVANWYIDPLTAPYVLYPHIEHTAIDSSGNITNQHRYITNTYQDTTGTITSPFLIPGDGTTPVPTEGLWSTPAGGTIGYAVDTDNDGVLDANYMDFGFPLMTIPGGTQQYVAMAAVRIIDADALLQSQRARQPGGRQAAVRRHCHSVRRQRDRPNTTQFISRSNQGLAHLR